MNIWRLKTHPNGKAENELCYFCLTEGVLAMGWRLKKKYGINPDEYKYRDFEEQYKKDYPKKNQKKDYKDIYSVRRLTEVKTGDLVLMKTDKDIYYFGIVGDGKYIYSENAYDLDGVNQRTGIRWVEIGNGNIVGEEICKELEENNLPTFRRINKNYYARVLEIYEKVKDDE